MLKFKVLFVYAVVCTVSSFNVEDLFLEKNDTPNCYVNSEEVTDNAHIGRCVKKSQCKTSIERELTTNFDSREGDEGVEIDPNIKCEAFKVCCPLSRIIKEEVVQARAIGCGYSNPGGVRFRESESRASYADYAEFPWMVALMYNKESKSKEEFKNLYLGGGTIIHPSVVLTVAHKLKNIASPEELKCRAGELNWSETHEIYKFQEREVAKTIVHPDYNKVNVHFDVALLILSSPFDVTSFSNVGVACLELNLPNPGVECFSMGWGKDIIQDKSNADTLKKITLPLVSRERCQNQLRNTLLGREFRLHHTFICAGGQANVDTCFGDGGSSLVCAIDSPDHARYSVVGMVAYGVGCGSENVPGVYVNVPLFYDWIINIMKNENLNSTTFQY